MSTVLVAPKPFTVLAANQRAIAPATNLRLDEPALMWRSIGATSIHLDVQLDGTAWDTFALTGTNLSATDTIRITAASNAADLAAATNLTVDQTFNAWSGTTPVAGAIAFQLLASPVTSPFVRIAVASTSAPAGYVEASRLVIGKRVVTDGVSIGAEQSFEDMSVVEDGPGFTTVDRYGVRLGWKVTLEGITDADYYANWFPFLCDVRNSKAFVFIPDSQSPHIQAQAIFCRITSTAKGTSPVADYNIVDLNLKSVG